MYFSLVSTLLSPSGQPAVYPEFFSLNRTTAELRLLKPVRRDLYQSFNLVIKVIHDLILCILLSVLVLAIKNIFVLLLNIKICLYYVLLIILNSVRYSVHYM